MFIIYSSWRHNTGRLRRSNFGWRILNLGFSLFSMWASLTHYPNSFGYLMNIHSNMYKTQFFIFSPLFILHSISQLSTNGSSRPCNHSDPKHCIFISSLYSNKAHIFRHQIYFLSFKKILEHVTTLFTFSTNIMLISLLDYYQWFLNMAASFREPWMSCPNSSKFNLIEVVIASFQGTAADPISSYS